MEQIERIRQLSAVALLDSNVAFARWGYPSTREEASSLIRRLDGMRTHDDPADIEIPEEETPVTETEAKVCTKCHLTKPIDEFGLNRAEKDGHSRYCKPCARELGKESTKRRRGGTDITRRPGRPSNASQTTSAPSAVVTEPAPVKIDPDPPLSVEEAWRTTFANPTLDQLTALQAFLGEATLDETARITRLIAESSS